MDLFLDNIYSETLEKLKSGGRPQIKLHAELIGLIKDQWPQTINSLDFKSQEEIKLKQILCILDHCQNSTSELNDHFINSLKILHKINHHELIVYCLGASQKHVIAESFKSGKMISQDYFDLLKTFLKEGHPEVKEWTLRTIETLGPLSLRFQKEVLEAKPLFYQLLNRHQKASHQIIEYLESEWKRMKL